MAGQSLVLEADIQSSALRREHETSSLEYRRQRIIQVAAYNLQLNALAPMHQLPVEIFSTIFLMCLADSSYRYITRLRELAQVAHRWRDIVAATPSLWAGLSETMSSEDLRWALKKAKGASLDVVFSDLTPMGQPDFATVVIPLASRWRSVRVLHRLPQLGACLASKTGLLEEIEIRATDTQLVTYLVLCEGVPLRSVKLFHAALPWTSNRLVGLHTLHIQGIIGKGGPSLGQIMAFLESSPYLESLKLSQVDVAVHEARNTSDPKPFSLLCLLHLELIDIPYSAYEVILSHMQFPDCKNIILEPRQVGTSSSRMSDFDHTSPSFISSVSSSLRSSTHTVITIGPQDVTMATTAFGAGRGFRLLQRVGPGQGERARMIGQISRLLQLACPDVFADVRFSHDLDSGFEAECLGDLVNLTSIELPKEAGPKIVQYLGRRRTYNPGETEWSCPNLTSMDLSELKGTSISEIRRWVKGRWEKHKESAGTPPEGLVSVLVPIGKAVKAEQWRPVATAPRRK